MVADESGCEADMSEGAEGSRRDTPPRPQHEPINLKHEVSCYMDRYTEKKTHIKKIAQMFAWDCSWEVSVIIYVYIVRLRASAQSLRTTKHFKFASLTALRKKRRAIRRRPIAEKRAQPTCLAIYSID